MTFEVLMDVTVNILVLAWKKCTCCLHLLSKRINWRRESSVYRESEDSIFFLNAGVFLLDHTLPHPHLVRTFRYESTAYHSSCSSICQLAAEANKIGKGGRSLKAEL